MSGTFKQILFVEISALMGMVKTWKNHGTIVFRCIFSSLESKMFRIQIWLVVSTHLKNISQNGNLPQIGEKIKDV